MGADEPSNPDVSLKDLSAAEFSRFSQLWDESIELAPGERGAWLAALERSDSRAAALLRALSASQEESRERGFLETSDLVASHVATLVEADPGLIGQRLGPYRVLALLGHGGMGSVWLAERADGLFARQVALKLIHPALKNRVTSERFAREREILASLNHPNIARLLDAGFAEDGQPYLALDYVAGTPLTTYCDEHRLSVRERLALYRQVLSALQYAHAHLVIHRDLKPANILVTSEGQVQLLDFGIAKLLSEGEAKETELTQMGGRALTPDYAAPEQIAGAAVTTAADVYALGVMLYELLTGERPYKLKRDSRGALEEAILQADPVPPSRAASSEAAATARATTAKKLASILKGDLDTIAIKALKKSPTERYATANAFGEDIDRYLRGDVVLAQPDSVAYRALKFGRRHWVGIAAASVLLLTLAGGLVATTYEAKIAAAQRDEAAAQRDAALQAQLRSVTQTAAARLKDADVPGALGIILEVVAQSGVKGAPSPEALSVFQEARAQDALVMVLSGHSAELRSAAFSPDGTRIVTAAQDKSARIWDRESGRELLDLVGHTAGVEQAVFSPDGTRVLTASWDKTARIWDAKTGRELLVLRGHADQLRSAAFSPDGRRIVTGSFDKTARVWDAATGRELLTLGGHADLVPCARFSPDGRRVVTASVDKTARIWDAATGREIARFGGHTEAVIHAAFSPDGQRVVTASRDKTARIWDVSSARELMVLRHSQLVNSAEFSPDGLQVVTASDDTSARLWDVATGKELMVMNGHRAEVSTAVFSPDGREVVTASHDQTARVWSVATGPPVRILSGHQSAVESVQFSSDGRRIVTASDDKTARIWDVATGRELIALVGHERGVWTASFSSDGARVVTAANDGTSRIWDAASGRQTALLTGHDYAVESAQFSPDGRLAVTASFDRTARIWDAASGRPIIVFRGHNDRVSGVAFSPDGRRVATASLDKTVRIWDAASGAQLLVIDGHSDPVFTAAYSPDGRRLVTASLDMTARIWDSRTGHEIKMLSGHSQLVGTAMFSSDGRRVVTASLDKTARIWDTDTGQQLMVFPHVDSVNAAAYSPDGAHIVTASDDALVRIWDARVPSLESQIRWASAALLEVLSPVERFRLGLPDSASVRSWPGDRSKCDESAAAPYDPDRLAAGTLADHIAVDVAMAACGDDLKRHAHDGRSLYQHARAQLTAGHFGEGRLELETATRGYRTARIDLAGLLSQPSAGMLDLPKAVSLYEQAWQDGVAIAGFELGKLYEYGVSQPNGKGNDLLAPDGARAWSWYRKAAAAGEPNALARIADRDDADASAEMDVPKKSAVRLEAFKYYASAAERARIEGWPDEAWRHWRYRRATLARLLAREGLMSQVADAYSSVHAQLSSHPPAPP
ncbi:MAG: protein kinase [Steroidobacteraceae bacterium]|jgi:WD40 repeat protein/serine/threonine protein kinase/TPR repeat protein